MTNFQPLFDGHQRRAHLDFHTPPHIPDVGCEFDARSRASTVKRAHSNSVTVFAKSHHGMCSYPTKTGVSHPATGRQANRSPYRELCARYGKEVESDMIEERSFFGGEILRFKKQASCVRRKDTGEELPSHSDGGFCLPMTKGRLLLDVPGYFS